MTPRVRAALPLGATLLAAGLLLGFLGRSSHPLPLPGAGPIVPPATSRVALMILEGVPEEAFAWPAIVPFFQDVSRRGCRGRLSPPRAPLRAPAPQEHFPYPWRGETLPGLLRRGGRSVLGAGPAPEVLPAVEPWFPTERELVRALEARIWNCVLVGTRVAAVPEVALRTQGHATPFARAILEEDRRLARIAGLLGSGCSTFLVYGTPGRGYRWAAAGPGILSEDASTDVSPQALVGALAALLGHRPPLLGGALPPPILDFPVADTAPRITRAWDKVQQRLGRDRERIANEIVQRIAAVVLVLVGVVVSGLLLVRNRFLD